MNIGTACFELSTPEYNHRAKTRELRIENVDNVCFCCCRLVSSRARVLELCFANPRFALFVAALTPLWLIQALLNLRIAGLPTDWFEAGNLYYNSILIIIVFKVGNKNDSIVVGFFF
jgi:hypothetical protein